MIMRTIATNKVTISTHDYNEIREALNMAMQKFLNYSRYHIDKDPPDFDKAKSNMSYAEDCYEALRLMNGDSEQ